MVAYVLAGMALGSIYAIASASLVATYVSAGILNFAFGSMAFSVARFYYWLHSEHGWPIVSAAVMALLVLAPLLGALLYQALFRHLRHRSTLVKIVSTVGLSVALPPIAILILGAPAITRAPGLAPLPVRVFHVAGTVVDLDQVIIYCFLAGLVVAGILIPRFTAVGLKVRAMVDGAAFPTLSSGPGASWVALGVWTVSSMLAGLAGVLIAPTGGLGVSGMTTLMAAAFAAVVAARLRNLPTAVVVSLALGVVTDVGPTYLPPGSTFAAAIGPSIPSAFVLLFLLWCLVRGGAVGREAGAGDTTDAVTTTITTTTIGGGGGGGSAGHRGPHPLVRSLPPIPLLLLATVAALPALTSGYWLGLVASGLTLAVVLLSFSLVIGDGGMLWLGQITFAGGGAITAAQLATHAGFPPLLAAGAAGVAMIPIGALLGALTVRLGDLYVAIVTLSFGGLVQTLVFTRPRFYRFGAGVDLDRPGFADSDRVFAYVTLGVFLILALIIVNVRHSTTGLGVSAVRWSEPAARTLGLNIVGLRVLLSGFAAFVAGLGGALMALFSRVAVPDSYEVLGGFTWIAVLVTIGSRSIVAAAVAGLTVTVLPGLIAAYLPTAWGNVPAALFGLGALGVALHPEGLITAAANQLRARLGPRPPRLAPIGLVRGRSAGEAAVGSGAVGSGAVGSRAIGAGAMGSSALSDGSEQ